MPTQKKTSHQLAIELLSMKNLPIVIEGWILMPKHEIKVKVAEYDPKVAIIVQSKIKE